MESNLISRRRISAFAAYNGLVTNETTSTARTQPSNENKSKKRRRRNVAQNGVETISKIQPESSKGTDQAIPSVQAAKSDVAKNREKKRRRRSVIERSGDGIQSNGSQGTVINLDHEIIDITHDQISNSIDDQRRKTQKRTDSSVHVAGMARIFQQLTHDDSLSNARMAFAWLIAPVSIGTFFEQYWEKRPLYVQRTKEKDYYEGLFSTNELHSILRANDIQYTVNLDITKYENGERTTLNPSGRAYAANVWNFYKDGCSIRLLNPQTYSENVWKFNSTLQEFFGTFVGANVYLTPPNTQGFAPHYDDIEAFVVQLEGVKRWRIYDPRNEDEILPRFSSPNFKPDEIGEPTLEVELHPGDLLYFPRGYIHQAMASKGDHSLHMTISTTQRNTFGDYLQLLLEQGLQLAMVENVEYRRSLPLNYMDIAGTVHMDKNKKGRKNFVNEVKRLLNGLVDSVSVDGAADEMAKTFMQDSLPPCLTDDERNRTIHGAIRDVPVKFSSTTKIHLIRRHCLRLIMESNDNVTVYYNTENSRIYRGKEPQCFTVEADLAAGIDYLVEMYPEPVPVEDLPLQSDIEKVRVCQILYEKALLAVGKN